MGETEADYGLHVWPCAEVLSSFILSNEDLFRGKRIIEIGCGAAVPSIVALKSGAVHVDLSDRATDDRLKNLAMLNCTLNGVAESVDFVPMTWSRFEKTLLDLPPYDVVLASDCFYDPSVFEDVLVTMAFLLDRSPRCSIYFSYQERSCDWTIEWMLEKWHLQCERMTTCLYPASVHIGRITRKRTR
ncbi:unnamed protein product [Soboliphyme baturini]|uniref:Methyltransferase-like protein 23 n=1 Tax=Soboliphyme baturini TaxID=241478 RepID=A0A183IT16_9BILA|nr:unnamed protein product [Soboliphyme baturini]